MGCRRWCCCLCSGGLDPASPEHSQHIVLAVFALMLVIVNSWITVKGMPVDFGWLDHWLLALAKISVLTFFLVAPAAEDYPTALERTR